MGINGCIVSELETDLAFTIMKIGCLGAGKKKAREPKRAGLIF